MPHCNELTNVLMADKTQNTAFIQHGTTYSMLRESILWKHYKGPSGLTSDDLTALCFDNLLTFERMLLSLT